MGVKFILYNALDIAVPDESDLNKKTLSLFNH